MPPRDSDPTPAPLALSDDQFKQLLAAITQPANAGLDAESLKSILLESARISTETLKTALRKQNDFHPGISAFSYPEGDVAKPRPALPFELHWNGFPMHQFPETLHWLELELLCRLTPGDYLVSKANNEGALPITVTAQKDATDKITKLTVAIDKISRDEMRAAPPLAVWIYQMLHANQPVAETYLAGTTLFMNHIAMAKPPVAETVSA